MWINHSWRKRAMMCDTTILRRNVCFCLYQLSILISFQNFQRLKTDAIIDHRFIQKSHASTSAVRKASSLSYEHDGPNKTSLESC